MVVKVSRGSIADLKYVWRPSCRHPIHFSCGVLGYDPDLLYFHWTEHRRGQESSHVQVGRNEGAKTCLSLLQLLLPAAFFFPACSRLLGAGQHSGIGHASLQVRPLTPS